MYDRSNSYKSLNLKTTVAINPPNLNIDKIIQKHKLIRAQTV